MKTVLNTNNPNNRSNKLFFGEKLGICNFADMKYPIFKKLYDEQLSFFWRPTEISMAKDSSDIVKMDKVARSIFEKNISFQTMGDSFLGQGIDGIKEHVTNNEFSQTLAVHMFFEESIHTPSYSHIFENIYKDPSEKFYSILNDVNIKERAQTSTEKFNALLNSSSVDKRYEIINTIVTLLALESISFYSSFSTSYFFARRGQMTGAGSIIELINRDEYLHKANSINALKYLSTEESEGFLDLKDYIRHAVYECFSSMATQEKEWNKYLLSEGQLPGLTVESHSKYVEYLTNKSLSEIGYKDKIFSDVKNPYPWTSEYQSSSKSQQKAPQEQTITSYTKNVLDDL